MCEGSYVDKDFTILPEENQLIGGRPAKMIKCGVRRVFSWENESKILDYFKKNPVDITYKPGFDLPENISKNKIDF